MEFLVVKSSGFTQSTQPCHHGSRPVLGGSLLRTSVSESTCKWNQEICFWVQFFKKLLAWVLVLVLELRLGSVPVPSNLLDWNCELAFSSSLLKKQSQFWFQFQLHHTPEIKDLIGDLVLPKRRILILILKLVPKISSVLPNQDGHSKLQTGYQMNTDPVQHPMHFC